MDDVGRLWTGIGVCAAVILLMAFLTLCENAAVEFNDAKLKKMAEEDKDPDRLERLIEEMSHYLAASGKAYQNYAAALHRWAANDKKGAVKQGIPDYTCMEGESL